MECVNNKGAIASVKLLVLLGVFMVVYSGAPPRFIKRPKLYYQASVGDTVKLKCLVTGTRDPMHNRTYSAWIIYRGGKTMVVGNRASPEWKRYRIKNGKHLRIGNVKAKDAGKFLCLAYNSHGRVNASIKLVVQARSRNATVYKTSALAITLPPDVHVKNNPPIFRHKKLKHSYRLAEGSALKLRCHTNGDPKPKIKWFFNNRKLSNRHQVYLTSNGWALNFRSLRKSDSGRYRCVVWNKHGSVNKTFVIRLLKSYSPSMKPTQPKRPLPHIKTHLLKNITAECGTDVTFSCTAESELPLRFNWLKWTPVNNKTNATLDAVVRVLNASEPRVRFIRESAGWVMKSKRSYCHKLKLLNVSSADEGQYTCVVGSSAGFVSHSVFLIVTPKREQRPEDWTQANNSSPRRKSTNALEIPMAALIGVPVAFGTILIVAIVWCYVQIIRHRARQAMKAKTVSFVVDNMYGRHVCAEKPPTENGTGITLNRLVTLGELNNAEKLRMKGDTNLTMALRNGDIRVENGYGGLKSVPLQNGAPPLQNGDLRGVTVNNEGDREDRPTLVENGDTRTPLRNQNTYIEHPPVVGSRAESCRHAMDNNVLADAGNSNEPIGTRIPADSGHERDGGYSGNYNDDALRKSVV